MKFKERLDMQITNHDQLYAATLAGDVISNGIYYATTATTGFSITSGVVAGLGAVMLPEKMGLNDEPVAETTQKKVMTVGYYLFGAIVTKLIYDQLNKS